eukprot:gene15659-21765_t
MESLKGHVEAIESEFGEAIVARDESLVSLSEATSLGPPDLCWLQKQGSGWALSRLEPQGFYHYVTGNDVSSSASGLYHNTRTSINRGFYCTYDPFTRLDIRCELSVPGGVECGALDTEGTVHEVTPAMWRNCQLAAFLRAELYDAELTSHCNCFKRMDPLAKATDATRLLDLLDPLAKAADESRLLDLVKEMYWEAFLPRAQEALLHDEGLGCTAEHMDVVLNTILCHFSRQQRWVAALEFFKSVAEVHPGAAVYV